MPAGLLLAVTVLGMVPTAVSAQGPRGYRVEVGAPADAAQAQSLAARLEGLVQGRHRVHLDLDPRRLTVRVGDFSSRSEAAALRDDLLESGIERATVVRSAIRPPSARAEAPPAESNPPEPAARMPAARMPDAPRPAGEVSNLRTLPTPLPVPAHRAELVVDPAPTTPAAPTRRAPSAAPSQEAPGPDVDFPYRGALGRTTCSETFGWIWHPERPGERVFVELWDGDRHLVTVPADVHRPDLERAGIGDGRYGFRYSFGESPASRPATVEARVAGTTVSIPGSPQVNPCWTADPSGSAAAARPRPKTLTAAQLPGNAIVVDGRLDEPAWQEATFVSDFQQKGLDRGFPRPEWTRVAFAYDAEALYVAARLEAPGAGPIDARMARRDEAGNVDRILVSLDTWGDRRTAYTFGVTAGGTRIDHFHPDDREVPVDARYDPVWEARTAVDSTGWTAELRIPFSQLRFASADRQSWGVNIRRWNPQQLMNHYWVVVPMEDEGWASRFGALDGLRDVGGGRRVELAPYVLVGVSEPAGPNGIEASSTTRVGADLKVGLGPELTLDAAVLPDFGQVEADPADVNLTAFETTFQERRPFFTEGAELFQSRQGPRYFYSRRVGAVPHGTNPGNAVDLPINTEILGAVKLSGRLDSGVSLGSLVAVTSAESTVTEDAGTPVRIAPGAAFAVVRAEREVRGNGSTVGAILTGVRRDLEPGSIPDRVLSEQAFAGGADWTLRFEEGTYEVSGHVGFSALSGSEEALAWIQRSSTHYFQRPDADHVELDLARTGLSGYTGGITFAKVAGTRWTWAAGGALESPGFNIRDAGVLRAADHQDVFASLSYRNVIPNSVFRFYSVTAGADASWNFGGVRQFLSPSLQFSGAFENFWRTYLRLAYEAPALSDELTRGGPLMATPSAVSASAGLASAFASRTQWSLNGGLRRDDLGGWSGSMDGGASTQVGPYLGASLFAGYSRGFDPIQYYGRLTGGPAAAFGQREIFSELERSELYLQARVDVSVTPDVSLQLYVEPFASSGAYARFGELTAASGNDLRRYGEDGASTIEPGDYGSLLVRDTSETFTLWPTPFNFRSFRSNAVLRWEWQPGSSVFLIWQQNRWGYEGHGEFVAPGSLADALGDSGQNILTLKVNYRLGLR